MFNFKILPEIFNWLNFFMNSFCYICDMENIQKIEEMILTHTNAWNETDFEIITEKIDQRWSLEKLTEIITCSPNSGIL